MGRPRLLDKEIKHDERRAELEDAASRLFLTKGYESVSIRDLEQESGLSRGAIYYYVGSKEEVYAGVVLTSMRRVRDEFIQAIDSHARSPRATLKAVLAAYIYQFENERPIYDLLQRFFFGPKPEEVMPERLTEGVNTLVTECVTALTGVIRAGVASGDFYCDDPEFVVMTVWGLMATLPHMNDQNERLRIVGRPRKRLYSDIERVVFRVAGVS
jgi:AcrR family transcriptional regulator